jgi:hypothetical protein
MGVEGKYFLKMKMVLAIRTWPAFRRHAIRISVEIPAIMTSLSWIFSVPPGKCQASISIRPWALPSKPFPIHLHLYPAIRR